MFPPDLQHHLLARLGTVAQIHSPPAIPPRFSPAGLNSDSYLCPYFLSTSEGGFEQKPTSGFSPKHVNAPLMGDESVGSGGRHH